MLDVKIHGVFLILIFVAGRSQEIVDLRVGKVDTICERFTVENVIKLKGKKILFDTKFKNFWKIRKEKLKQVRYFIRDDGEEKVKGVFRRRYEKVNFIIWVGRTRTSPYRILMVDNRDKKMTEVQKGSRVDICMYCEQKESYDFISYFRFKNLLIKMDGGYEVSVYVSRHDANICYLKSSDDFKIVK